MAQYTPVPRQPDANNNLYPNARLSAALAHPMKSLCVKQKDGSVTSATRIQSSNAITSETSRSIKPSTRILPLPPAFLLSLQASQKQKQLLTISNRTTTSKGTPITTRSAKESAITKRRVCGKRKRQNPCTKLSKSRGSHHGSSCKCRRSRTERYNEIRSRKVISKVNSKQTKYKCPNQTAREFHAVYAMLNDLRSSKMMSFGKNPPIMNMNEQIEIFGRKIPVVRDRSRGRRSKSVSERPAKKQKTTDTLCDIRYAVTETQWKKRTTTRLKYEAFCKFKSIKPNISNNDRFSREPDDFKMVKQMKTRKARKQESAKIKDEKQIRTPSKLNRLFTSIVTENGNEHMNSLKNWRFVDRRLPSNKCMECGSALHVIPMKNMGEGIIEDSTMKSGSYSAGMFKIAVICTRYPDCTFPVHRPAYSKYWIVTAWYDDRRRKEADRSKSVSVKSESSSSQDSQDKKPSNIKTEHGSIGGKLAESASKLKPVRERVNSYEYLRSLSSSLSTTTNSIKSRKARLNAKNLKKLSSANERRRREVVVIDDSRSDISTSTTSLLSATSMRSINSSTSRLSASQCAPAVPSNRRVMRSHSNVVLK